MYLASVLLLATLASALQTLEPRSPLPPQQGPGSRYKQCAQLKKSAQHGKHTCGVTGVVGPSVGHVLSFRAHNIQECARHCFALKHNCASLSFITPEAGSTIKTCRLSHRSLTERGFQPTDNTTREFYSSKCFTHKIIPDHLIFDSNFDDSASSAFWSAHVSYSQSYPGSPSVDIHRLVEDNDFGYTAYLKGSFYCDGSDCRPFTGGAMISQYFLTCPGYVYALFYDEGEALWNVRKTSDAQLDVLVNEVVVAFQLPLASQFSSDFLVEELIDNVYIEPVYYYSVPEGEVIHEV